MKNGYKIHLQDNKGWKTGHNSVVSMPSLIFRYYTLIGMIFKQDHHEYRNLYTNNAKRYV